LSGVAGKVLRGAAKTTLVVLAAFALLVGVTWMFLQTRRGGEVIRRLALPRVNAAIAGTLTVSRVAFGGDRLTLEDLALTDPEGHPVGSVEEIDVSFSPLALLRRHVDVKALTIRRPELALVQDERGLNLLRAVAPRRRESAQPPAQRAPGGGGPRGRLDVRSLVVTGGVIDYRSSAAGHEQHVHVADLSLNGKASAAAGRLSVDLAVRAHGGQLDARAAFDAAARRGFATGRASLRGVSIAVDGRVVGDAIDGHASVEAGDLAATARGLVHDFGMTPIAMAGHGRIDVACGGTSAAPSLKAAARFSRLVFGDASARDLTASARIPNLRRPDAADVDAGASLVVLGRRRLGAPSVTIRAASRQIAAHAAIAAPQPLRVDLAGERRQSQAITVSALSIRTPEETWTLRRPVRVSLVEPITVSGLELAADGQRLAADLRLGGARPTAHVVITHLDLARLPRALVPEQAGLGGSVDADVRAELGEAPRVIAKATVTGGRIAGHRDLTLEVGGRLERGRAQGDLRARGLGLDATARFDLPAEWPPRHPQAPLALTVETGDADLAAVAAAVGAAGDQPPPRLRGHARLSLHLDGRVGRPRLAVTVAGRGLAFDDHQIGDVSLAVNGEGDGALAAQISSVAPAHTRIDITSPLSVRSLLRRPPSAAELARTRFEVKGTIDRLPLAVLARALGRSGRVGGTLSSTLSVAGTVSAPEGQIGVDLAGASADRYPPTDARIEIDLERDAIAARVRVVRRQRALLAIESRLGLPVGGLLHPTPSRLGAAPVRLRAVFGPYLVQRLGLPPLSDREPPRQLEGRLHADVTVDGTLAAPELLFHAQASDLRLDKTAVGFGRIEATYANRHAKIDARLTSAGGGTLQALGGISADLGYPALVRGVDVRRAPLDVRFEAERFDVRGLSGAVQALRTVGGQLTASATVRGTVGAPRPAGRLEWTDGVLTVSGFGAYQKIHLAVHGDEHGLTLDELSAASGSGKARVTGSAKPAGAGAFDVAADAKLDRFPFRGQGQTLAVVSLASKLRGRAAPGDTRLRADIDDAHVELTDAKRKDLQPLDAPADIVLVERGAPLNKAQEAKLRALRGGKDAPPARGQESEPSLRLAVHAPRQLWVDGKDAKLELGLSPDFHLSIGEKTEIFGQVTVHRGRVDIFGRRFDVKGDSTLSFHGPPDRPELDVRAEHVNTTENITVLLTARGPLDKMVVTVTSPNRPDLGESQLYTLIVTGHLTGGSGGATSTSPSSQAASFLGGLLASKLQSTLARRLPLDVFTIDVGGEGISGTKLEAGRYVSDRLYVGYIGRVGSDPNRYQNRNAVRLDYQITSRWAIEGEYGDLGTGTADLMWKKNY